MRTLRTIAELRAALAAPRRAGDTIGLVPTMGALHEGHLSLIRQARAACDVVVVTLFVNPAQFDEASDLDAYPRDEQRDARLAEQEGADVLFAPAPEEIYPPGFATSVRVGAVTEPLEGESRGAEHFAGVATVVAKLLNIAQPDVAYFGQKDAQQVAVIRRLVRDLDIPARIAVGATVREADGLALSSRNVRLRNGQRSQALALPRALEAARGAVARGERDAGRIAAAAREAMRAAGVEPEYLALVAPDSFDPVQRVDGEPVLVAVAARVGDVRLIDNELLTAGPAERGATTSDRETPNRMTRTMLKSKIHRATVTDCDLHYVGSITIDPDLLDAADILEHEQVAVVDVDNGARFETYTIAGERGSGEMRVNGAAARLVQRGDTIIVISYAQYAPEELVRYEPVVVHVRARTNEIIDVDNQVATLLTAVEDL